MGTDNTAPLSGTIMRNNSGSAVNTTMYGGFSLATLTGADNPIRFALDVRHTGPNTSGTLNLALGYDGGTPFTADVPSGSGPTGDDKMLTVGLATSSWFADQAPHHVFYELTLRSDGNYDRLVTVDSTTAVSDIVASTGNPTYQFNQASIFWNYAGSSFNEVDNILIKVRVPEPATLSLLAVGGLFSLLAVGGLLLWRHVRQKTFTRSRN